jgi:hypothetical protein
MLSGLGNQASSRKYLLFACTCVRRLWHLLPDERSREAVKVTERFVDGRATEAELQQASDTARAALEAHLDARGGPNEASGPSTALILTDLEGGGAYGIAHGVTTWTARALWKTSDRYEEYHAEFHQRQPRSLRDIFGNPFQPVSLDPSWVTPDVLALAQAVYEDRVLPAGTLAPDRLAVLSDALQDAGCGDATILSHCRSSLPHYRGCWVVDLLLGKQ